MADKLICIGIIVFGIAFVLLGAVTLLAMFGDPSTDGSAFLAIGLAATGYGWRCVKGFDHAGK
jgi:membrane protein implicated in regulation of membrane protease activity